VFEDFLELTTLSFSNITPVHDERRQEREDRYLQVIGKYKKPLHVQFQKMLADLVSTIEQ
jgi:hypothetical protein